MQISMTDTNRTMLIDGVRCRRWLGATAGGTGCNIFVHHIEPVFEKDAAVFEQECKEKMSDAMEPVLMTLSGLFLKPVQDDTWEVFKQTCLFRGGNLDGRTCDVTFIRPFSAGCRVRVFDEDYQVQPGPIATVVEKTQEPIVSGCLVLVPASTGKETEVSEVSKE